ncbi:MFS transporter [Pluralibacter sp.]|uniref:MFS transporter n=1 Tax=Pluralibacter sp. TaxID=1920032 RepID=UPI0025F9165D|nr:MFS transporter [Pluralibacter sp.]MBV8043684.1 MFS transporter [Pluralibacter sp.]
MGDIFGSGAMTITGLWLLYFYIEVAGLSPAAAASIFAIAKIWDGITDPVMGYITDNIRTRWGRRRIFFILGAPLSLCFALMWVSGFGYFWYLGTYLLFSTVFTLLMVPYDTLPAEMTSRYDLRSKMSGTRMLFAQATAFLSALIPGQIMAHVPDKSQAFLYIGIVFAILFALPWLFVWRGTWERENLPPPRTQQGLGKTLLSLYREMASTFRLRTFRIHIMMYVGGAVALDIFGSLFMHYMTYVLQVGASVASQAMSLMTLFQFFAIPLFTWLCIRMGNGNAYKVAIALIICALLWFSQLSASWDHVTGFLLGGAIVMGIARGGTYLIPWNVYNFLPDVDEAYTGVRREGIYAGVMMLTRKFSQALALFIVGFALEAFGFTKGVATQSASALNGIWWVFLVGPGILTLLALYGAFRFRLSQSRHQVLVTELERLRGGGKPEDAAPQVREVVELLTGHPHRNRHWQPSTVTTMNGSYHVA